MFWTNAPREHRALCALYGALEAALARSDDCLFGCAPHVSGWTPAQHLHHLTAINSGVCDWLKTACDGRVESAEGAPSLAGHVLLWAGCLPRGRGRSPKRFVPPDEISRAALEEQVAASRAALDGLEACAPRMKHLSARQRHPVMGMLNATQWMRFARIHTEHHVRILRDILHEQGGGTA